MHWSDTISEYMQTLTAEVTPESVERLFGLVDLTSLNDTDTEQSIAAFFKKAYSAYGHVAAVCVYPKFVRLAAATYADSSVKVATVVNFPAGTSSIEQVLIEINQALEDGAHEIDVVFPYQRYMAGDKQYASDFVKACKAACGDKITLKVIMESGAFDDLEVLSDACLTALTAGADFIKTSTGKIATGATFEATSIMLLVLRHVLEIEKRPMGIKISGGVKELSQALRYIAMAEDVMGVGWVKPATFRIGASKLVDEIISFEEKR